MSTASQQCGQLCCLASALCIKCSSQNSCVQAHVAPQACDDYDLHASACATDTSVSGNHSSVQSTTLKQHDAHAGTFHPLADHSRAIMNTLFAPFDGRYFPKASQRSTADQVARVPTGSPSPSASINVSICTPVVSRLILSGDHRFSPLAAHPPGGCIAHMLAHRFSY